MKPSMISMMLTVPILTCLFSCATMNAQESPDSEPSSEGRTFLTASDKVRGWSFLLNDSVELNMPEAGTVTSWPRGSGPLLAGREYGLYFRSRELAYFYIAGVYMDKDGRGHVEVLYPLAGQPQHRIQGERIRIPRIGFWIRPQHEGIQGVIILASRRRVEIDSSSSEEMFWRLANVLKIDIVTQF